MGTAAFSSVNLYVGGEITMLVAKFTSRENQYLVTLLKVTYFLQAAVTLCDWGTLLSKHTKTYTHEPL